MKFRNIRRITAYGKNNGIFRRAFRTPSRWMRRAAYGLTIAAATIMIACGGAKKGGVGTIGADTSDVASVDGTTDTGFDSGPDSFNGTDTTVPCELKPKDVKPPKSTHTSDVRTLIEDYIDRTLQNRGLDGSLDEYSGSGNVFSDGIGGCLEGTPCAGDYHVVDGSKLPNLADKVVLDYESGNQYEQTQRVFVSGDVAYRESQDDLDLDVVFVGWSTKFDGNLGGIPVCTKTPTLGDGTSNSNYSDCVFTPSDSATARNRVEVMFLGQPWIVTEMVPPITRLNDEQQIVTGGKIKLARETDSRILNKGEQIEFECFRIVLEDVESLQGKNSAIVGIYVGDDLIQTEKIGVGTTQIFVEGYGVLPIYINKISPGYTFNSVWAEISVLVDEVELVSGEDVTSILGSGDSNYWKVTLGWRNLIGAQDDDNPDILRTVIVWSDEVDDLTDLRFGTNDWTPGGGAVSIGPRMQSSLGISFDGLDVDDSDRVDLNVTIERTAAKQVSTSSVDKCTIDAPYAEVTSASSAPFVHEYFDGGLQTAIDSSFFVALESGNCEGVAFGAGTIFIRGPGGDFVKHEIIGDSRGVTYPAAGSSTDYNGGGEVRVWTDQPGQVTITLSEAAIVGSFDTAYTVVADRVYVDIDVDGANTAISGFRYDPIGPSVPNINDGVEGREIEEGYVTARGSIAQSFSDTTAKIKVVAGKVARAVVSLWQ